MVSVSYIVGWHPIILQDIKYFTGLFGCHYMLRRWFQRAGTDYFRLPFLVCNCYFQIQHRVIILKLFSPMCTFLQISELKINCHISTCSFHKLLPAYLTISVKFEQLQYLSFSCSSEISLCTPFYNQLMKMLNRMGLSIEPWKNHHWSFSALKCDH